ncbi:MAG: nucleotide exchange factor GrpE, partial [Rhodospirillaceae bacterium]|nr:nucleotide exchange factor GrpE [Rhodospirillaceae bacterium]
APFALDEEEAIDPLAVLRDELAVVREELAGARAEAAQYKDQLLRALAESENQRRRAAREREDAVKFAGASLAKDLLAVADNLDRALANIPEDALENDPALKTLHEGVAATQREVASAFERHRIRKIDPKGEKFDSHRHQAMFEIETADEAPGHVAQVLQPGYVMHDERLLRPALVAVAKAPAAPKPANDSDAGGTTGGR